MLNKLNYLILFIFILSITNCSAKIAFKTQSVENLHKSMSKGEIEIIEFESPVSELHYIDSDQNIVKVEKSEAAKNGYHKFIIKALNEGSTIINFKIKNELVALNINVSPNYKILEEELNKHFGLEEASAEQKIQSYPKT